MYKNNSTDNPGNYDNPDKLIFDITTATIRFD